MAESNGDKTQHEPDDNKLFKAKLAFLFGVTFASVIGGFGLALGVARKRSPTSFSGHVHDEGAKLAMRAFGWGTLISVSGVTAIGIIGKSAYELKKVVFN
ncbi:transmembrane protein 242-like [Dendronephthya gigantea]|uniref:transmembrane protein 242-like n=1 Tax=Dendronephthya gigantea TaxID=151771 RepID=UPI001069A250|nr:transmembrane protein 242-like [Dendronephthya gigantea]